MENLTTLMYQPYELIYVEHCNVNSRVGILYSQGQSFKTEQAGKDSSGFLRNLTIWRK